MCPGWGTPLGLRKILHKFYTNLLSLLRLFAPCLPYSYQQDDRARATREGAYEADIRTATIPVSTSGLCGEFRAETDVVAGHLVGRVEHIVSGQATTFQTLENLLAFMARIHRRSFKCTFLPMPPEALPSCDRWMAVCPAGSPEG